MKLTVRRAADITPETVSWLWHGRLPLGKTVLLDGDPGLGKSTLLLTIAAAVTTGGILPDGKQLEEPAAVIVMSCEDGAADTIVPRLLAAGADLSRVVIVDQVDDPADGPRLPEIPTDLDLLQELIEQEGARLVIIDPLVAYLPAEADSRNDQRVRRALAPLASLADATGAAIVCVRHLNKAAGGPAIYRGGGSIGFIGAARVGLLVTEHPSDPDQRVLLVYKSNLAKKPAPLTYRLDDAGTGVARVTWTGTIEASADELLAPRGSGDDDAASALDEATTFLREALADGPRPVREVEAEARQAGISERTLNRARRALGLKPRREGFGKTGAFYLDPPPHRVPLGANESVSKPWHPMEGLAPYDKAPIVVEKIETPPDGSLAIECQNGHRVPSSERQRPWHPMAEERFA